jgi:hypothetical protein
MGRGVAPGAVLLNVSSRRMEGRDCEEGGAIRSMPSLRKAAKEDWKEGVGRGRVGERPGLVMIQWAPGGTSGGWVGGRGGRVRREEETSWRRREREG